MISRIVRNKYVLLAIGIVVLAVGLLSNSSTVSCGSHTMRPGDTCEHTTDGVKTGTYTYDQQKASDKHSNIFMDVAGGAITVGALVWIVASVARRKKAEPGPAQNPVIASS